MSAYARKQGVVRHVQKFLRGKYRRKLTSESRKTLANHARLHRQRPHSKGGVMGIPIYPYTLR